MTRAVALRVLLLGGLLTACSSTNPSLREVGEEEVASWEEACQEEQTLTFLCDEEECAFYRCRDVMPGQIVEARGGARPPTSASPGRRNNRRWHPGGSQPVFVIPWRFHDHRPLRTEPLLLTSGRWERHHIFPQASDLAAWFKQQGVDIHTYTILLPAHVHARIHSGGPRGGLWNETWRRFQRTHPDAKPEEIWRQAGRMLFLFDINGPLVPYR